MRRFLGVCVLFTCLSSEAGLAVKIGEPKAIGSKVVIPIILKNTFTQKVESSRAVLFLTDDKGKVVGQSTQWVIGGPQNRTSLASKASASYNFTCSFHQPFTKTKLIFNRIVLEGGKLADPVKDVQISSKIETRTQKRSH